MSLNLLILGGTGFVGRTLCEILVEQGHRITVPTRSMAKHKDLGMLPGLTLLPMDIHQASLAPLVRGHDAVINLVAILHGNASAFEKNHVTLLARLMRDMHTAGVRRLVHFSALGVPDGDPDGAPSNYLRSKARGEALLRGVTDGAAGLQLTVLRPSVIFGAHDHFINLFATLQRVFPILPLGGAQARFQPVWVQDVARAVAQCLADTRTIGQTYECVGPQVHTLIELARLAGEWAGRPRPVWPLPLGLARLQAALLACLPGPTLISQDNLRSMQVPNVATGRHPGLEALGIRASRLQAVMPQALSRGATSLDRWRQLARR